MSPTSKVKREVEPRVPKHWTSKPLPVEDQVRIFREARKAREEARLNRLRENRMKNATASSSFLRLSKSVSATQPHATEAKHLKPPEQKLQISRPRRSIPGRSLKQVCKLTALKSSTRKGPKAEVKLTKTTQLRLVKADPLLQISFQNSSIKDNLRNLPFPNQSRALDNNKAREFLIEDTGREIVAECSSKANLLKTAVPKPTVSFGSSLKKSSLGNPSKLISPSRIPVRKTSFQSPFRTSASTPNPSPLRERLEDWLEKRKHSLENFKHLRCFGICGPVVKRPQTPFRKVIQSTSSLTAIPESAEAATDLQDSHSDDDIGLNTTFTLEDEDKENICSGAGQQASFAQEESELQFPKEDLKKLDEAFGVLNELHKLIQLGYPIEQCKLWVRAIRRRFPQCGDEPIYWECLASLEEHDGDLPSAASCYERAILQGAEGSVQESLDELLKKMAILNIRPLSNTPSKISTSKREKSLLDGSNVIKSCRINFAVQEIDKLNSSARKQRSEVSDTSLFIATPVRRSSRLAASPKPSTPGFSCVRSLEFLEPTVRKSLVFQGNSALDPID